MSIMIKWKTVAVYVGITAAVVLALAWRQEHHRVSPVEAPKHVVVPDNKPFQCSPAQYERGECEPVVTTTTEPATVECHCKCPPKGECLCTCVDKAPKVAPVPPKPAPKPVPPKPKPPVKKPVNLDPRCQLVPQAAYDAPTDVVIEAARRRGLPETEIAVLKWCIGAR